MTPQRLQALHAGASKVRADIERGADYDADAHASIKTLEAFLAYLLGEYTPAPDTLIAEVLVAADVSTVPERTLSDSIPFWDDWLPSTTFGDQTSG